MEVSMGLYLITKSLHYLAPYHLGHGATNHSRFIKTRSVENIYNRSKWPAANPTWFVASPPGLEPEPSD